MARLVLHEHCPFSSTTDQSKPSTTPAFTQSRRGCTPKVGTTGVYILYTTRSLVRERSLPHGLRSVIHILAIVLLSCRGGAMARKVLMIQVQSCIVPYLAVAPLSLGVKLAAPFPLISPSSTVFVFLPHPIVDDAKTSLSLTHCLETQVVASSSSLVIDAGSFSL